MQKIRIKKAPQPGDQQDYSLVGRNVKFTNTGEGSSNVKNTMTATSVDKANIEVEGGETVVGDINKDGFLEQFTFVGKRHSQGGMPVNIPEGSFIFSDTKKLKIKDTEILESLFGLKEKKGGYTPAEIAKKYQINQFVQDLKSEDTDPIQKRSSAEMLKKNTQKLGMLALIQESMKGFPDGIPAIAESVMAGLQGAQIPGMEQGEGVAHEVMEGQEQSEGMRYGGTFAKYVDGGGKKPAPKNPAAGQVGHTFYINNTQNKIAERYNGFYGDEWVTFEKPIKVIDEDGNWDTVTELMVEDWNKMTKNGSLGVGYNDNAITPNRYTDINSLGAWGQDRSVTDIGRGVKYSTLNYSTAPTKVKYDAYGVNQAAVPEYLRPGKTFNVGNKTFKVVDSNVYSSYGTFDGKRNAVRVQRVNDPDQNFGSYFDTKFGSTLMSIDDIKKYTGNTGSNGNVANQSKVKVTQVQGSPFNADEISGQSNAKEYTTKVEGKGNFRYAQGSDGNWWFRDINTGKVGIVTSNSPSLADLNKQVGKSTPAPKTNTAPKTSTQPAPVRTQPRPTGKPKTAQEALNYFADGGMVLDAYQVAGTVAGGPGGPQQTQPGTLNTTVATQQQAQAAGNQRVDPNKEIFVGDIQLEDGTVVKAYYKGDQKYVKDTNGNILAQAKRTDTQFEQYGSKNINQILANATDVKYTNTNFGSFANQPNVKGTGIYLSSGNANARQSGDLSPEEWQDFKDRHGDWIEAEYSGPSGKGFAAFQKDLKSGKVEGDKATGWFQDTINEKSMKQFGVPYFSPLGAGKREDTPYYRDSKFGQVTYSVPRFFDAPKPPQETPGQDIYYYCVELTDGTKSVQSVTVAKGQTPTPPSGGNIKTVSGGGTDKTAIETQCKVVEQKITPKQPPKQGPWWIQDIVNFVGAVTDRPNRYEPVQSKIDSVTPGYDLLDPTRKLAANQEQMARYQNQVQNTADGNVGLATTLGASGEGFANAANVLDVTEAANIGIVNNAYDKNAAIENQERVVNEAGRAKYIGEMATLNQQYDDALKQDKWTEIAAFNNGTSNWFRKKQMDQVLFPQVYTDPIFGDVEFSGVGREIFGPNGTQLAPDVYQNPLYAGSKGASNPAYNPAAVNNMVAKSWQDAYNTYLPIMGEEQAKIMASKASVNQMNAVQNSQNPGSWQQQYQNAFNTGATMPAAFNATPWDDGN